MVVQNQQQIGEGSAIPTDPQHTPTFIEPSTSQPQKTQKHRKPRRKDTKVPQPSGPPKSVADEVVYKERDDSLVRATTTASSLEVEQDSGNINMTQSKATPNESSSQGSNSGGGPRCQETIRDTIAQTRFENVSKQSYDPLLARDMFNVNDLNGEEVFVAEKEVVVEPKVSVADTLDSVATTTATTTVVDEEITLAQTLIEIKSTKPKAKGIVMQEPSESTPTISLQQPSQVKGQ
ncbi:hypothetical protein Tco_0692362 [Tanacetum coccineum]